MCEGKRGKRDFLLPVSLIVAALIIAVSFFVAANSINQNITALTSLVQGNEFTADVLNNETGTQEQEEKESSFEEMVKDAHFLGEENAPVTMVEFSDFECYFCKKFHDEIFTKIHEQYIETGKVKYIFRHLPSPQHHFAQKAAEATECAGEQGKFWEMYFELFQDNSKLDVDSLREYAFVIELDMDKFDECFDGEKYKEKVGNDFGLGIKAGITGTPSFFINGDKIVGYKPFENFQELIEKHLETEE